MPPLPLLYTCQLSHPGSRAAGLHERVRYMYLSSSFQMNIVSVLARSLIEISAYFGHELLHMYDEAFSKISGKSHAPYP